MLYLRSKFFVLFKFVFVFVVYFIFDIFICIWLFIIFFSPDFFVFRFVLVLVFVRMARLVRRYRRGYPRYYRRNWSRWPYRSWRRGVRSSQVAGNRRFNVVIPVQDAFSVEVDSSSFFSNVQATCPFYYNSNAQAASFRFTHGSLLLSQLYRVYTQLYDEVKINSVSMSFQLMNGIGIGGTVPALKFITSWDRDCNYAECVNGTGVPTAENLITGSESQSILISNTSSQKVFRYNRATDLMEKCTFHDCTLGSSGTVIIDKVFAADTGNNRIGYCPSCFFVVNTAVKPEEGTKFTFNISLEIKYNVTFRNPKYGLAAGNAKGLMDSKFGGDDVSGASEIDEETIKKLKALLHEDVQLPITEEDTRMSMEDDEKDEKVS